MFQTTAAEGIGEGSVAMDGKYLKARAKGRMIKIWKISMVCPVLRDTVSRYKISFGRTVHLRSKI